MNPEEIDTEIEVKNHQIKLNQWAQEVKYWPLVDKPLRVDGIYGGKTEAATLVYEDWLREQPASAVPWWNTRRMKGILLEYSGLIVGVFGAISLFMPSMRDVDIKQILTIVTDNLDNLDALFVTLGTLAVAGGKIWNIIGSIKAKAPIDPTLIAKVGSREIRVPQRSKSPKSEGNAVDDALGNFKSN